MHVEDRTQGTSGAVEVFAIGRGHQSSELTENLWFHSVRLVCSCIRGVIHGLFSFVSVCWGSPCLHLCEINTLESCSELSLLNVVFIGVSFFPGGSFDLCVASTHAIGLLCHYDCILIGSLHIILHYLQNVNFFLTRFHDTCLFWLTLARQVRIISYRLNTFCDWLFSCNK